MAKSISMGSLTIEVFETNTHIVIELWQNSGQMFKDCSGMEFKGIDLVSLKAFSLN